MSQVKDISLVTNTAELRTWKGRIRNFISRKHKLEAKRREQLAKFPRQAKPEPPKIDTEKVYSPEEALVYADLASMTMEDFEFGPLGDEIPRDQWETYLADMRKRNPFYVPNLHAAWHKPLPNLEVPPPLRPDSGRTGPEEAHMRLKQPYDASAYESSFLSNSEPFGSPAYWFKLQVDFLQEVEAREDIAFNHEWLMLDLLPSVGRTLIPQRAQMPDVRVQKYRALEDAQRVNVTFG